MIGSTPPSHSSNEGCLRPISKKNEQGLLGALGDKTFKESSELRSNSLNTKFKGQLLSSKNLSEKIPIRAHCITREGASVEFSIGVVPRIHGKNDSKRNNEQNTNDNLDPFDTNDDDSRDFLARLGAEQEDYSNVDTTKSLEADQKKIEDVQKELIDAKKEIEEGTAVKELKDVSSRLDIIKQNLGNHAIVIDHEKSVGDKKYIIAKRVDRNDKSFKERLAQEKSQRDFGQYASTKNIKIDTKEIKEFCSDIGRLKPDGTVLLPPSKTSSNLKNVIVILLDDLTIEEQNQIDELITENRLPPNIRIRNAAAMEEKDHEFIQQMVADYFTLSLQEHYLTMQIQLNAQQSNSQKSTPIGTVADKTQTNSTTPIVQNPKTAAPQREGKPKKAEKIKDGNKMPKGASLPENERSKIRKSAENIRQKNHRTLVAQIKQKWNQYDLGRFFNNQDDCLKFYLQFVEKSKTIKEVGKKLIILNDALKEEFRLNSEEFDLVIRHVEELMDGKKNYKLDKIIRLVLPTFNKTSNRSPDNDKNFSDPLIEEIIVQKLNRILHIHSLIS